MNDLEKAESLLVGDNTCVLVKGEIVYELQSSGIKPLLSLIEKNVSLQGFSLADRIIGKAAAMLVCYAGIENVYSKIISKEGYKYLFNRGVFIEYDISTENIVNRCKTDMCPMEKAVQNTEDFTEGYEILSKIVKELANKK